MVPTLVAVHFIVKNGEAGGIPKYAVQKAEEVAVKHINSFKMAMDKGINIAMGTDAGTPFNMHGNSAIELQLMVEAGMSPMQAIVTSTKNSSELIGVDQQYGTLEVGKFADFLVLNTNPLDDITTLQTPVAVYKKGKLVD
jgi:imidazolonepropionase-like amidohydrolase